MKMISLDSKICMEEKISTESSYPIPSSDEEIKEFIKEIPKSPGVYKFLDVSGNPLYIGKAKLLNKRVASYFRRSSRSKKIEKLLTQSQFIDFALTNTELESLLHEQYLIKELKPKFNVQFKDDKGYPWIKIETKKAYPAAKSFLGKKLENGKFFGPFPNSYAVRDALKLIQKIFKLRKFEISKQEDGAGSRVAQGYMSTHGALSCRTWLPLPSNYRRMNRITVELPSNYRRMNRITVELPSNYRRVTINYRRFTVELPSNYRRITVE